MTGAPSLNYRFMLDQAVLSAGAQARILDFGCGVGPMVRMGLAEGLDIRGADTFAGHYDDWLAQVDQSLRDRIDVFTDVLPYADGSFDVVIANMVFEHIPDLDPSLSEIARVLRPGGVLLACFPVRETWREGHVGLWFAHRFARGSRLRHAYMSASHRLGLGLYRTPGQSAGDWARSSGATLDGACVFHPKADALARIGRALGSPPADIALPYIDLRLSESRLRALRPLLDTTPGRALKRFVVHAVAGVVVRARKADAGPAH